MTQWRIICHPSMRRMPTRCLTTSVTSRTPTAAAASEHPLTTTASTSATSTSTTSTRRSTKGRVARRTRRRTHTRKAGAPRKTSSAPDQTRGSAAATAATVAAMAATGRRRNLTGPRAQRLDLQCRRRWARLWTLWRRPTFDPPTRRSAAWVRPGQRRARGVRSLATVLSASGSTQTAAVVLLPAVPLPKLLRSRRCRPGHRPHEAFTSERRWRRRLRKPWLLPQHRAPRC